MRRLIWKLPRINEVIALEPNRRIMLLIEVEQMPKRNEVIDLKVAWDKWEELHVLKRNEAIPEINLLKNTSDDWLTKIN
jgi:hypothetical protein